MTTKSNNEVRTRAAQGIQLAIYDVADQLRSPEEMAAYLKAWKTDIPDDVAGLSRAKEAVARAKKLSRRA